MEEETGPVGVVCNTFGGTFDPLISTTIEQFLQRPKSHVNSSRRSLACHAGIRGILSLCSGRGSMYM